MIFTSDNATPVHPAVMDALAQANSGGAPSYGTDPIMDEVRVRIRDLFEAPEAAVFLVATGSAANALSLAAFCPPWAAIFCHRHSHIEEDECGAPEFYTGGAKLKLIDGDHGRMDPDALRDAIEQTALLGVHNVQKGMVSLTNVTELGGVYSETQVRDICAVAQAHGLPVHMDGARFANALVATGATPAEISWRAGVDVLSFGGTKNGLMGVEAVVIFDPARAWEFELRRKRGGHLFSKHRFLSAQMLAYLTDDLWRTMAEAANRAGGRLAKEIAATSGARLLHPADANMIFAEWPRGRHRAALEGGASYYPWPGDVSFDGDADTPASARLVTSWCTTDEELDRLLDLIRL